MISFGAFDGLGLLIVAVGVFMMNWFKEKAQKVCIVDDDQNLDDVGEPSLNGSSHDEPIH